MSFTITTTFVSNDIAGLLSRLASVPQAKVAAIVEARANSIMVPAVKDAIIRQGLVFEGTLRDSVKAVVNNNSAGGCEVLVGAFSTYSSYFEIGRPAGTTFSPSEMSKLTRWAAQKLGANKPTVAAQSIANSIKNNGMRARPFLVTTAQANEGTLVAHIAADIIAELVRTR